MREKGEKTEEKGEGDGKAGWREREETSESAFPAGWRERERKHLTQLSLARKKENGFKKLWKKGTEKETTFLRVLCLSPLCRFLSQLRTSHHTCTAFPPDPSIHPKGEERSQSAPDFSHPMPSNPSSLSTWTPPSFSSSPPAAFLPGCPGIMGPCAIPGPEGNFVFRLKSKRLLEAACGVWLRKR